MDYTTAAKIMEGVHLRKDWSIHWFAGDGNTMLVEIKGLVDNSSTYPKYGAKAIANGNFIIRLDEFETEAQMLRVILDNLILMAIHEEREFLRYGPTWVAPFHPHTEPGVALYRLTQDDTVSRSLAIIANRKG